VGGSSATGAGATQWPGGTLALATAAASGQYYCSVPGTAEALAVQGSAGPQVTADQQLVYAAAAPQPGSAYQTVDLSDSTHHLLAATGQAATEVIYSLTGHFRPKKVQF